MKKRSCALFLLFVLITGVSISQNYTSYYQQINKAEEHFVLNRDSSCFALYDEAFNNFQPFLKDPYIAAQIALFLGDSTRFHHYLKICFQNGMPITAVNASPIIRKSKLDWKALKVLFEASFVEKEVDKTTLDHICLSCYQSDSIKMTMAQNDSLIHLFNDSENRTRDYLLNNFLVYGKFPNERLIGISSDKLLDDFHSNPMHPDIYLVETGFSGYKNEEYELRAKCPFNIVLHSSCFYRNNKDLFQQAMLNGYVHPKELGILEETAILWNKNNDNPSDICSALEGRICYNIFGNNHINPKIQTFTNTPEGLLQVEANRKAIYMQKYSVDLEKKKLESEFGFKFFFDFKDR